MDIQYDNHPNPFKKVWNRYIFYDIGSGIEDNFSDNNFIEVSSEYKDASSGGTSTDHYKFYYLYNGNGLPVKAWQKDLINGDVYKYLFFYTK